MLPMVATLLATSQPQKTVFLTLTVLNMVIYGWMYSRKHVLLALHLVLVSIVALVGGLPDSWGHSLSAQFDRQNLIAGAVATYVLVFISMLRNPKLGLLGALVAGGLVGAWGQHNPDGPHWAVQAGLVFLLLHSLRWVDSVEPGADLLRWLTALAWVADSLTWVHLQGAGWRASAVAVAVLCILLARRLWRPNWGPVVVLVAALLVLIVAPVHLAVIQVKSAPAGLLAVIGSFALFALGTLGAITKHHWGTS